MTIRLDLSFLSGDLRSIIVNSKEIKSFSIDRSADLDYTNRTNATIVDQHDPKTIITLDYKKESLEEFKVILRDILVRNHMENFTIAEDTEAENTVAILREGDLEQFGIYVCKHCGTTFKSIDERIIHERIHYFV
jgi:rubrerythrin